MTFWAHPTAIVDQPAQIGEGTKIWHFCHVMAGRASVPAACWDRTCSWPRGRCWATAARVQNNVSLYDDVILEDDVFVAPRRCSPMWSNPRSFIERKHEYRTTRVGRGAR